jgi:hypothetical protein
MANSDEQLRGSSTRETCKATLVCFYASKYLSIASVSLSSVHGVPTRVIATRLIIPIFLFGVQTVQCSGQW